MNKKELEGVVFDADGTLFDTERLGYWAWEEAGRQMVALRRQTAIQR